MKNYMKKPVLLGDELVRLVVPSYEGIGWGRHAHVARCGQSARTVCGTRITAWWFWQQETQTVAALCNQWRAEGKYYPKLHFQGMHLGAPLDIKPDLCRNCSHLVLDGKRPRWAGEKNVCPDCFQFYESCNCDMSDMSLEESLVRHGFSAGDAT